MRKTVVIYGTLDTKGEEFLYLKTQIESYDVNTLVVDLGTLGQARFRPDITAAEVAAAAGKTLDEVRTAGPSQRISIMQNGVVNITRKLIEEKKIHAAITIGGGQGGSMTTPVFQMLPIGMPKIMISTLSMLGGELFGNINDTYLTNPIVDIAGLNSILKQIIRNAAASIAAMAKVNEEKEITQGKKIAASMFGITTKCVEEVGHILTEKGYEFFPFHANGAGGQMMERLILEGYFDGVCDITTSEVSQHILGGACDAGSKRMEAAGKMGIPQIVVPGAVDDISLKNAEEAEAKFEGREVYFHNPTAAICRTNEKDNEIIAKEFARKLNAGAGKTILVCPLKGLSEYDKEGMFFYQPQVDEVLFDTLEKYIDKKKVQFVKVNCHINDSAFAKFLAMKMIDIIGN